MRHLPMPPNQLELALLKGAPRQQYKLKKSRSDRDETDVALCTRLAGYTLLAPYRNAVRFLVRAKVIHKTLLLIPLFGVLITLLVTTLGPPSTMWLMIMPRVHGARLHKDLPGLGLTKLLVPRPIASSSKQT